MTTDIFDPGRTIVFDWNDEPWSAPGVGDHLVCISKRHEPTGTAYLILTSRMVKQRNPEPGIYRMHYRVVRVELGEALQTDRWFGMTWNSR